MPSPLTQPACGNTPVQTAQKKPFRPENQGFNPDSKKWDSGTGIDWLEFTLFEFPTGDIQALWRSRQADMDKPFPYIPEDLAAGEQKRLLALFNAHCAAEREHKEAEGRQAPKWTAAMIPELVGLPEIPLVQLKGGNLGYNTRYMCGPVQIFTDGGTAGMGLHVSIPAGALDECRPALQIIRSVLLGGGKITRIDVAYDDFAGLVPLPKMAKAARAGKIVSRAQIGSIWESFELATGKSRGLTLYLGRRTSDIMWRIYDKWAEMFYEHKTPERLLPPSWIRIEGEFKDEAARNVSRQLFSGADLGPWLLATINGSFSFREKTKDKDRDRWPLSTWWKVFIQNAGRNSIGRRIAKSTMEKRRKWFTESAAPTMAMLMDAIGERQMLEIFKTGLAKVRTDPKKRAEVEEYRQNLAERCKDHREWQEWDFAGVEQ